jgi:hypothetical protein
MPVSPIGIAICVTMAGYPKSCEVIVSLRGAAKIQMMPLRAFPHGNGRNISPRSACFSLHFGAGPRI